MKKKKETIKLKYGIKQTVPNSKNMIVADDIILLTFFFIVLIITVTN